MKYQLATRDVTELSAAYTGSDHNVGREYQHLAILHRQLATRNRMAGNGGEWRLSLGVYKLRRLTTVKRTKSPHIGEYTYATNRPLQAICRHLLCSEQMLKIIILVFLFSCLKVQHSRKCIMGVFN